MKNKGLKIFGGLLAILVVAFIIISLSLGGIVKSGIEENASELFGTRVSVDNVNISIFDGSGSIQGFRVQNPRDFSDEAAIDIEEASIKIDIASLFSDQILVKEIIIKNPEVFFEQQGVGANLKSLNDNMKISSEASSDKTMIIERLFIEDGTVRVSTTIDRQRVAEASLDEFELEGIGRDGSNTVKQSVRQIMEPLLEHAIAEALKSGVTEQLQNKVEDLFNE